ncbi:hypothetical protein [Enterobacter soli]|uniref:Uncharacterized protein n=1 Tax=Enterobacter soli TaxID=885040 RepID=A0AAW8H610_9ENTR|nr:hypothetical protein [Enterobacter soli]MDQ2255071.1 hypothetical protein [Enterobacter soli]MDQ2336990.1 hypothetical protein [Enterobacter soli]
MSTITREFTKEQLQQIEAAAKEVMWPVVWSEKKAREHFSEKITPNVVLKLARIALASLEAEPVAYTEKCEITNMQATGLYLRGFPDNSQGRDIALYTAPPAPVSVPAAMEMDDDFDSSFEHGKAVGWNAYRAAMLQGAEPVKTANKLPFEQWLSQQTGTIDVECGCVMTEVFFHWLRVAYETGNSPVIPDGWVMVPVEPTAEMISSGITAHFERGQIQIHDRPAPGPMECAYVAMLSAAPQQEA